MGALLTFRRRTTVANDAGVGVLSSCESSPRAATVRYALSTTRRAPYEDDCLGRIDALDEASDFRAIALEPRLALFTGDGRRLELERMSGNGSSWMSVRRVGQTSSRATTPFDQTTRARPVS